MVRSDPVLSGVRRVIQRYLVDFGQGTMTAEDGLSGAAKRCTSVRVEPHLVVISYRHPKAVGAGPAVLLADRAATVLRGRTIGGVRLGAPVIDLDGRDPRWFRATVTLSYDRDHSG